MIDIGFYIKKVLLEEESIILQGLGQFIAKYKPAEIKSKSGNIAPPTKQILFDDKHKVSTGKFLDFINSESKYSEEEIKQAIEAFSEQAIKKLELGEHVRIDQLGYLYKDKAYKIQFIQDTTENILLDTYGLNEIEWDVNQEKKESTSIKIPVSNPEERKRKLLIIPIAALVVVILVLVILISDKVDHSGSNPLLLGNILSDEKVEGANEDEFVNKPEILQEIDSITDKNNALYFEEDQYKKFNSFYVIVGSFSIYNNAEQYMKEMRSKGFNAEVLEVDGKIFRVSLNVYNNRQEALIDLDRMQKQFSDRKLWILNSI